MRKRALQQKNSLGFTLIETLVAVSIFTLSVLTMLIVLSQGLSSTLYAKKKATAGYLAQEGIEYVRNMRDTYTLYDSVSANTGWVSFTTKMLAACNSGTGCYFDPENLFTLTPPQPITKMPVTACGVSCPQILYNPLTTKYGYSSGTNSGFIRKIIVTPFATTPNEVTVTSVVYWSQGSGSYQITLSEELLNWWD